MAGNSPPDGHPNWVVIGKNQANENIWGPPGTKPTAAQLRGGSSGSSGGGSGGSSGSSSAGDAKAKKAWRDSLLANYRAYIGDTDAKMPPWMARLKYENRSRYTSGWLRAKYDEMGYLPKKQMERYKASLSMKVQEWLGRFYKPGDKEIQKLLNDWSKVDPDKRGTSDFQLFVHRKLSKTKAFQAAFPGYDAFSKAYQLANGKIPLPDDYRNLEQEYKGILESLFGIEMSDDFTSGWVEKAIKQAWTADKFRLAVRASPDFKNTAGQQQIIARFNNLWSAMFEGTRFAQVQGAMAEKFRLSGMEFDEFFDLQLQQNPQFKSQFDSIFPEYEGYRTQFQRENPGAYISIETFMQRREELKSIFQDTLENYDMDIPTELLSQALAEGWSDERTSKYLKTSPEWSREYMKTNEAKVKAIDFNQYWKGILGTEVAVDTAMLADYVANGSGDPTEYLNKIRETDEFRAQYGFWDEFLEAQTRTGHTNEVINNPEVYKQFREGMMQAFADIGEPMPEGYDRMFFKSGISTDDLSRNLFQWREQERSYDWATAQKADMATAAGITNPTQGGDLRNRMQKALEQHKKFSQSKFNQFSTQEKQNKIVTKI